MSAKKKFKLEYTVRSSPRILYNFLSNPAGLQEWFADKVNIRNGVYEFEWRQDMRKAVLLSSKENKLVKFKWEDDEPYCYFEFEINQDEITNDVVLVITDFAEEKNHKEEALIWNNTIEALLQVIGA